MIDRGDPVHLIIDDRARKNVVLCVTPRLTHDGLSDTLRGLRRRVGTGPANRASNRHCRGR
jgi:hypothetical protein